MDHLKTTQSFDLKLLEWLVFDEADRFTEMGFTEPVAEILNILLSKTLTTPRFQLILCSATMTKSVKDLGGCALRNPIYVESIETKEEIQVENLVPNQLRQFWIQVPAKLVKTSFIIRD